MSRAKPKPCEPKMSSTKPRPRDEPRKVEESEPKPLAPKATLCLCGTRGLRFHAKHAVSTKLLGRDFAKQQREEEGTEGTQNQNNSRERNAHHERKKAPKVPKTRTTQKREMLIRREREPP